MSGDTWFTQKRYGYGVTPVNWKGWAFVAAIPIVAAIMAVILLPRYVPLFIIGVAFLVALTFVVCSMKSEGRMRWRWGSNDPGEAG